MARATVGTDQRPGAGPDELLVAAAAATACRRAGPLPADRRDTPPVAAPADPAPVVAAGAANRLAVLLEQRSGRGGNGQVDGLVRAELLTEWLRLASERGRRLPPEQLPALLDEGRRRRELRPLIVAAGGARAGWLARQQPDWAYLAEYDDGDPTGWPDGTGEERVAYLAAARRRDPADALSMLRTQWTGLPPEQRAALVGALAPELGPGDEEFLETALDDRRREVRSAATDLLGRLPGSRYAERMADRARACLSWDGRTVRVRPPTGCDRAMRRDGISARAPVGIGERAWWLEEILARTPLATWDRALAGARVADDWEEPVRRGLARAAAGQRDAGWASMLLDQLLRAGKAGGRDRSRLAELLYPVLAPGELLARAERSLRKDPAGVVALPRVLESCPTPWPAEFSSTVVAALLTLAHGSRGDQLAEASRTAALRLPPGLAAEVTEQVAAARSQVRDAHSAALLDRLADTLLFRYEMTQELT